MIPEIAALDRALAVAGEPVLLRRFYGVNPRTSVDVECMAFVRGYKPQELIGSITQTDIFVILSPTEIERAKWPGGSGLSGTPDPRVPRKGDSLVVRGTMRNVEAVGPVYARGELVRIEMNVKG
ncbi:hypothetical protein [Azospirillum griseum]|uniref:Uncharacterized protein n=1 Tax=Azospirillum griseum TaxID=2496639 RepID=A0A3S0JMA9_9PROT|nr:hypothetical protein [Azospirillum griseum]RTR24578.1 hypothetical protein EJ903_02135 [Azospirillum griseum]